jgi:hypothetical protein
VIAARMIIALGLVLAAGCATIGTNDDPPPPVPGGPRLIGAVEQVSPVYTHVVVRCVRLPSPGQRATVIRDGRVTGHLIFRSERDGPMAAADRLDGDIRRGDWVIGNSQSGQPSAMRRDEP